MFKSLLCVALLWMQVWSAQAAPDLDIGTLHDYLDSNQSTLLKKVRNIGSTTAFVKVSVAQIQYDRDGTPSEVSLESQDSAQRSLVVTPSRLIVPAAGAQNVRLLFRGERDEERYFRVRFIPILPEDENDFDLSKDEATAYRETLAAGVHLLKGFGAVLLVRPNNPRYDSVVDEPPGFFRVRNKGNATLVLESFKDCDSQGGQCANPSIYHVRPGQTREFKKMLGRVYSFELREGETRKSYAFKG
ncbi:pilus assembly protein [Pseudomonas vranovensis]|uniref:pilus assembly protein n=1 Tax=Pseudomonas vranovensis TaxID=321661 RepID=UPI0005625D75|nr:pilus assembly protein [Pseudomonas vranovensis]